MNITTSSDTLHTPPHARAKTDITSVERYQAISLACLYLLVFFNLVQVFAAFAGFTPHPPVAVVPMIVATAGIGIAAIPLIRLTDSLGSYVAIVFALVSMIGMGPHKLLLANGLVIAPVALLGFFASIVLIANSVKILRQNSQARVGKR